LDSRHFRPPAGKDWYYKFDQGKIDDVPHFIVIKGGSNFQLYDLTILDSPSFNVVLDGVKGAEVSGVNITSTWYTDPDSGKLKEPHNTDGIDPMNGAQDPSTCTKNVVVENCQFELGHGASIGSVGSGCVENVIFRHITMDKMDNGCRAKAHSATDGKGIIKNITWSNIQMKDTGTCITVSADYSQANHHDDGVQMSDLTFEHITGKNCDTSAEFKCKDSMPCKDITLNDVHVDGGDMNCENAEGTAKDTDPDSCLDNLQNKSVLRRV